jgi:hypothetical protein
MSASATSVARSKLDVAALTAVAQLIVPFTHAGVSDRRQLSSGKRTRCNCGSCFPTCNPVAVAPGPTNSVSIAAQPLATGDSGAPSFRGRSS